MTDVTPIFLFSLPRSGSTLVQRVLAAHDGVGTASEPWVLLPLLSPLAPDMPLGARWDATVAGAVEDFVEQLPRGEEDYLAAVRRMALDLYGQAAEPGTRFFLDKTPPYHLIAEPLLRAFPDARFVFLWRNPLSVVSSIVETLADGRWSTSHHRGALFHGLDSLVATYERHRDRVFGVRFEDLVAGEEPWRAMLDYIGLDFDRSALERFSEVRLEGRMGDPTGVHAYRRLSAEPVTKWRTTVVNPVRREWCRRYLRWLGRERLGVMGYDLDELLASLAATEVGGERLAGDLRELVASAAREAFRARLPGNRLQSSWRALLGVDGGGPAAGAP